MSDRKREDVVRVLESARRVADRAAALGAFPAAVAARPVYGHIGALLADAALQAGLNYASVVRPRVNRILVEYPSASETAEVVRLVRSGQAARFLQWTHETKLSRFCAMSEFLHDSDVSGVADLRHRIKGADFRSGLRALPGIGPKTVDYIGCLTGVDTIAVDRHVRSFALSVGLDDLDYETLRTVFSYAADLLEMRRRDFDSWVWSTVAGAAKIRGAQMSLALSEPGQR